MAQAERWRSVAAASAVVERREASGPRMGRAPHREDAEVTEQRLSAFRFPFFFVALSFVIAEERLRRSNPEAVPRILVSVLIAALPHGPPGKPGVTAFIRA